MNLTDVQLKRFQEYSIEYNTIFSNKVVQGFFQKEQNITLLLNALDGDKNSQIGLEEGFRKHFFRIRFIKFLVSTIRYCAIDQLRLNQTNDRRNQLIFDNSRSKDDDRTFGEFLQRNQMYFESQSYTSDPIEFQAQFKNDLLANAFATLSHKQQLITTLCYALCYKDNEIARIINVTPQSVNKTRNLSLQKLRLALSKKSS